MNDKYLQWQSSISNLRSTKKNKTKSEEKWKEIKKKKIKNKERRRIKNLEYLYRVFFVDVSIQKTQITVISLILTTCYKD